jgi:hypothetical protein
LRRTETSATLQRTPAHTNAVPHFCRSGAFKAATALLYAPARRSACHSRAAPVPR